MIVHIEGCPHGDHPNQAECRLEVLGRTTCGFCSNIRNAKLMFKQRILDNLQTSKDEAVAAGQAVRATVIQNMIDRVSAIGTDG